MKGHRLCDTLFLEAVKSAFNHLPPEQQETIDAEMQRLISKIPLMGPGGAMETIAKIGIFDLEQQAELRRLLLRIEEVESEGKGQACKPLLSSTMIMSSL